MKQTVQSSSSHSKLCNTLRTKERFHFTVVFSHADTCASLAIRTACGQCRRTPLGSNQINVHSHTLSLPCTGGTSIIWIHEQYIKDTKGYMTYLMSFVEMSQPRQENCIFCAQQQAQVGLVANAVLHYKSLLNIAWIFHLSVCLELLSPSLSIS